MPESAPGHPHQFPASLPLDEATALQDPAAQARARELSVSRAHPPAQIPGYQIQRSLGTGAYGSVWLAQELATGKSVAIKFYSHRRGLDWSLLNREVEKLAVLYTSRNIVGLIHVGWDADPPFYVMEYLENGSLAQLLQSGPLSAGDAVRIGQGILLGLVHAHGSGILHCDLKPANVLLDRHMEARLADFGQSRLSYEREHALGTLFYMAPEQTDLDAVPDARWDVYAFGVVLYQMLTGKIPYRTDKFVAELELLPRLDERLERYRKFVLPQHAPRDHWSVKGVDRALAEIVDRCLERDPVKRFPNAQAVLDALASRNRQLVQRPLLMMGVVVPLALLVGLGTIANYAMSAAVRSAQSNLIDRALESDVVSVKILARSIERELEDRIAELQKVASDGRLARAIRDEGDLPWEQRTELRAVLNQWKERVDRDREALNRELDQSWFLTNNTGRQIFRSPFAETVDDVYAFRDYFHGRQVDYPKDQVPADIQPISKPYVSLPYRSEADADYRLAVTIPVRDPESNKVIGVLGRSLRLSQLLDAYKPQISSGGETRVERTIALYDGRPATDGTGPRTFALLDHPWLAEYAQKHPGEGSTAPLPLYPEESELLARLQETVKSQRLERLPESAPGLDRAELYHDPVSEVAPERYGGEWLAAFWPIGETNWVAVVQERKALALRPIAEMEARLTSYLYGGLFLCCGLIGGLWYFIYRVISGGATPARITMKGLQPAWQPSGSSTPRTDRGSTV